ncbi:hexose carrier protein HEX6-like [Phalaenopsis equestris]|uniref:hexose carrier protein HEX6-like n=1 Tax=Phalaenopsis equestris TaxID=78828 RepID=UPI0009E60815|nr:hexose carrier protein HEX6-like [Phalaenopsis equestris]
MRGEVTATASFLNKFFPDVYAKMERDNIRVRNYCQFNSQVLTAFTSCLYISGLFSSLLASRVTEKYGRRPSMLIGGALFLAGTAMGGAAVNVYMLILARILHGFAVGFTNQSIPLYLSEMAPPARRGAISGGFQASISFGLLISNLVNFATQKIKAGWGWRISLSSAAIPSTFLIIAAIFLPETPSSIIQRGGDHHQARLLLQNIRGTNVDVKDEFENLIAASAQATKAVSTKHPFLLLLRRNYRPHIVMAVAIPVFFQTTGINAVNVYSPVMFRTIGQKESAALLSAVVTRLISFIFTITATMVLADRVGRRALFFTGGVVMLGAHVALGAMLNAGMHDQGAVRKEDAYVVVGLVCVFLAAFGWSWGSMAWLLTSEIYPMEIRSAAQSVYVSVNFLTAFAVAQSLLALLCGLKAGLFFVFAGGVMGMTGFAYWFVPETKGAALEQMGSVWIGHWYWNRFVSISPVIK